MDAPTSQTSEEDVRNDEHFIHSRLDRTQPSIRLMRVLPSTSTQGLLQCHVWPTSVTASYTCISYRWGEADVLRSIEINGKPFQVRQNLYDLLEVLYAESRLRLDESISYWIDALCIDQTNILERNHQVAQMGQIFSNAVLVHVWLGRVPQELLPAIQAIGNDKGQPTSAWSYKVVRDTIPLINKHIIRNLYFSRAWITQEILLARGVIVRTGTEVVDFKYLRNRGMLDYCDKPTRSSNAFRQFTLRGNKQYRPEHLFSLLEKFRDRECHDPRDQIYSLLSLSSGEGSQVNVDYDFTAVELAANVMRACSRSLCLCSTALVLQALKMDDSAKEGQRPGTRICPCIEFDAVPGRSLFASQVIDGVRHLVTADVPDKYSGKVRQDFRVSDTCESNVFENIGVTWTPSEPNDASITWGMQRSEFPAKVYGTSGFYAAGKFSLTRDAQR